MYSIYEVQVRTKVNGVIKGGADFKIVAKTEELAIEKALLEINRMDYGFDSISTSCYKIGWVSYVVP